MVRIKHTRRRMSVRSRARPVQSDVVTSPEGYSQYAPIGIPQPPPTQMDDAIDLEEVLAVYIVDRDSNNLEVPEPSTSQNNANPQNPMPIDMTMEIASGFEYELAIPNISSNHQEPPRQPMPIDMTMEIASGSEYELAIPNISSNHQETPRQPLAQRDDATAQPPEWAELRDEMRIAVEEGHQNVLRNNEFIAARNRQQSFEYFMPTELSGDIYMCPIIVQLPVPMKPYVPAIDRIFDYPPSLDDVRADIIIPSPLRRNGFNLCQPTQWEPEYDSDNGLSPEKCAEYEAARAKDKGKNAAEDQDTNEDIFDGDVYHRLISREYALDFLNRMKEEMENPSSIFDLL